MVTAVITQHSTSYDVVLTPMLRLKSFNNAERLDASAKKKKPRTNHVKPTTAYAVRKERKRILEEEAENLQNELDKLKFQLLVEQGQVDKASKHTKAENLVLHEFIQEQHLAVATSQAALTGHVQRSLGTLQPAQSVIHLGKNRVDRYNMLMALKERKLYEAERYLVTRSQGLEIGLTFCQEERFSTADGDSCVVRFANAPACGGTTKDVFAAVLGFVMNAAIFLSEMFGTITIQEDSDIESSDFAQLRTVSLTSSGAMVESNSVVFSKFVEGNGREIGSYGIMVQNFVDSDELHPYYTDERVRHDTTAIVMVRALPPRDGNSPEIVVTRWSLLKIHSGNCNVSHNPETEMRESSVCWGDTAQKCMKRQLMNVNRLEPHV